MSKNIYKQKKYLTKLTCGYFDSPEQESPAYDPGLEVDCPLCRMQLTVENVKTISLMHPKSNRSYFYRTHKDCYDNASHEVRRDLDSKALNESEKLN